MTQLSNSGPVSDDALSGTDSGRRKPWIAFIIAIVVAVTPLVALLSANALAPLAILAALAILILGPRRELLNGGPVWLVAALGLLTALGLVSSAWSLAPSQSIRKALQLLPMFAASYVLVAAGCRLPADARERIGRALTIGIVVAIAFVTCEAATGGLLSQLLADGPLSSADALIRYKRGVAVLALLAGPAAYWLWCRVGRYAAIAVLGGAALSAALVHSGAVMLAMAVGFLATIGAVVFGALGRRALAVFVAVIVLAAPLTRLGPKDVPEVARTFSTGGMDRLNSAMHRLLIWQFVGEKIAERPVLGWGLDTSRLVPGGHEKPPGFPELMPLHPHNAALQLWLELGLIGAVLGAFVAAWPLRRIGRTIDHGLPQAAATGVVVATVMVALVSFGIWQSWWIGAIALVAMSAAAVFSPRAGAG